MEIKTKTRDENAESMKGDECVVGSVAQRADRMYHKQQEGDESREACTIGQGVLKDPRYTSPAGVTFVGHVVGIEREGADVSNGFQDHQSRRPAMEEVKGVVADM